MYALSPPSPCFAILFDFSPLLRTLEITLFFYLLFPDLVFTPLHITNIYMIIYLENALSPDP